MGILAVSTPCCGLVTRFGSSIDDHAILHKRTLEELDGALCLAISVVTGPMIRETVQIARAVQTLSGMPIITGVASFALRTRPLRGNTVDVVVKRARRRCMLELFSAFEAGESLKGVAGVGYRKTAARFLIRTYSAAHP